MSPQPGWQGSLAPDGDGPGQDGSSESAFGGLGLQPDHWLATAPLTPQGLRLVFQETGGSSFSFSFPIFLTFSNHEVLDQKLQKSDLKVPGWLSPRE